MKMYGSAETFIILVKNVDGEMILFHDSFVLQQHYAKDEHNTTLAILPLASSVIQEVTES